MSIKVGFFNSVNGDRTYNADDMVIYQSVNGDGIVANYQQSMQVSAVSGGSSNRVVLGSGKAYIFQRYVAVTEAQYFNLDNAQSSDTYDYIYIYVNLTERTGGISSLRSSSSNYTGFSNTSTLKQIPIAKIYRPANQNYIYSSNITDLRTSWASFPVIKTDLHQSVNTVTRTFPADFTRTTSGSNYIYSMDIHKSYFNPSTDDCIVAMNGCVLQRDRSSLSTTLYYTIDNNGTNDYCKIKIQGNSTNFNYFGAYNSLATQFVTVSIIKDVSS